jgi:hypothetical protein
VVAATVVSAAAPTSRCGPMAMAVSRGGSPDAAALAAARGALDERRLIGTHASDLSTLAGARAGTIGVTLRTGNTRVSIGPSESRTHEGNATNLKLEKPRFLFIEGSGGAAVAPAGAAVALAGTSAVLTSSSNDNPTAGASTPAAGASSAAASMARGDGGGGFHLSGGLPPVALLFLFPRRR